MTLTLMLIATVLGAPGNSTITEGASEKGPSNPTEDTTTAEAGNITHLDIDWTRRTEVWQGFYGNVSGSISLQTGGGDVFYEWNATTMQGEVLATRDSITDWSAINCTNSTHWETEESALSISTTSVEGINETYDTTTHAEFSIGSKTFDANTCRAVRPFVTGGVEGAFYNIMLNTDVDTTVYTAILAEDTAGFDSAEVDFELLVPVNTATGQSTYYFYVEIA
ncbi:hypothetical protein HON49_03880 [archaeon]|nr:hypothetical protein [archaeon]